jgi:ACT domain-containing protein
VRSWRSNFNRPFQWIALLQNYTHRNIILKLIIKERFSSNHVIYGFKQDINLSNEAEINLWLETTLILSESKHIMERFNSSDQPRK